MHRRPNGRLGWAINALADPDLLSRRNQYLTDLVEIAYKEKAFRLAYAHSLIRSQKPVTELLNLWLAWWRDVMLISNGFSGDLVNIDLLEDLTMFADNLTSRQIIEAIKHTYICLKNLNYNVNLRLNLEVLLLNLPNLSTQT